MTYSLDHWVTHCVRATQQASVILNLLSGRGVRKNKRGEDGGDKGRKTKTPNSETVRRYGASVVLGHLQSTLPSFEVRHRDPKFLGSGWEMPQLFGSGEASLEVVVSGVDGARDLLYGRDGGSMSLAAVGERGAFPRDPRVDDSSDFLVVVAGHEVDAQGFRSVFADWRAGPINDVLTRSMVVPRLARTVAKTYKIGFPTLATVLAVNDDPKDPDLSGEISLQISQVTRGTIFCGSSVAAAIQVLRGARYGIDAFIAVVRRSHAALICAAAKALRGRVVAVSVRRSQNGDSPTVCGNLLGVDDFVGSDQFALVGTGVSESMLFRGVRYYPNEIVGVNSVVISGASQQASDVRTRQRLDSFRFRALRSTKGKETVQRPQDPQDFDAAVQLLREYIGSPLTSVLPQGGPSGGGSSACVLPGPGSNQRQGKGSSKKSKRRKSKKKT